MTKIKTLIAHNDINVTENIASNIKELEYVEIVGSANTGKETLDKIIELKPEIVFVEYDMKDMDAVEMMEKAANYFGKENTPEFKFITKDIIKTKFNDKYELNKKENKRKNKKESALVNAVGTKGIIEELEKYIKNIND